MQPVRTPPTLENQARLSGLDDADTLASISEHIAFLQGQIRQCDARIRAEIAADTTLACKAMLLESIPGIRATTAAVLIAELPELGIADKKQSQPLPASLP